jgi:DNA-binding winged helix-turn-helix (wHTH) protein/tetratricopeptide (TPR) repeat protein
MEAPSSYAFGPFVFHTLSRRLEKRGELVVLNSRATDLLSLLLARAGELVTKDELLHAGWGNRIVAENNLTVHMAALRRVLRDGGEADSHIWTEHGRGYRFVTPVEVARAEPDSPPDESPARVEGGSDARGISIQVLPVQGMRNDERSRLLAAEIRRHLMVHLSRIPGVLVSGAPIDNAALAASQPLQHEGARYLLRTSIQASDGDAQVIAMVDDASSRTTIWADRFEHRHIGLSSLESEISSRLTNAVITELLDRESAREVSEEPSIGAGAQQCALRGWSALSRGLLFSQDVAEARQWFDRALLADPLNPSALAGLAYAIVAGNIRATTDRRASLSNVAMHAEVLQADELATRAAAHAPDWPRAWFCRGYVRLRQHRFESALSAFERALSLDPCDAESLAYAGHVQFLMGRLEEMRAPLEHAIALSPRDRGVGLWHHFLGQYHFSHERDEAAIPYFVQGADLCPSLVYPVVFLASSLAHAGRVAEGRRTLRAWCDAMGGFHLAIDHLRAQVFSDNRTYLACHERMYRGLRLIGIPEQGAPAA